ncbi:MAG: IPT/TIG domain-containing protein [Acidimicrobiales bacterium]
MRFQVLRRVSLVILTAGSLATFTSAVAGAAPTDASGTINASEAHPVDAIIERLGSAVELPPRTSILGSLPPTREVRADVVLTPQRGTDLARYAALVSSPSSRLHRDYLPPSTFANVFAPAPSTVRLVETEMRGLGLKVGQALDDGFVIPVGAAASTLARAFRTRLLEVRLPDHTIGQFATSAPAVPAAIASSVATIVGLDDLVRPQPLGLQAPAAESPSRHGASVLTVSRRREHENLLARSAPSVPSPAGPAPCAAATAIANQDSAYTPDQIADAYGLNGLYRSGALGAGQTIDLFESDSFDMSDIATFDRCFFGRSHTSQISVIPIDGGEAPGPGGGEAALDIEEISALAPAAHIDVYEAPVPAVGLAPWLDEIAAIVAKDRASVVSMSYGFCEAFGAAYAPGLEQAENVLFQQAALEGQSWFVASGDTGSEACSQDDEGSELSVSDPASQPYVTAVGGTSMLSPTDPPTEVTWNDEGASGFFAASGGGISSLWQMPEWQSGLPVPGVANSYSSGAPCGAPPGVACREVPDVSASADPLHGDTVYVAGQWSVFGGTSASAPKWAAVAALTDEVCASEHKAPVGFVDPALYQIASNPLTYAEAFNDITAGNNDALGVNGGAYPATGGYDMATGLGTPRVTSPTGGRGLADLLCADGESLSPRPVLTDVSPDYGPYQGGTPVTITGTDLSGVSAVNFGSSVVPVAAADVNAAGTEIKVTTPPSPVNPNVPGAPIGGVIVAVGGPSGSSEPSPLAEFHFVDESPSSTPLPSVSFVSPSSGRATGGEPVTLIGSGFDEGLPAGTKPTVEFGGVEVRAAMVTVVSDSEVVIVVPPETRSTECATAPAVPIDNICQVEVTVSNANGKSATTPILPAPTGSTQVAQPPGTEIVAAPTEFDYAPEPSTTSISPDVLPEEVNPSDPPIVTIDGSGFNFLTFRWITFGPIESSYSARDTVLYFIEPDEVQVAYYGLSALAPITSMPVTVQTSGGSSNAQVVTISSA